MDQNPSHGAHVEYEQNGTGIESPTKAVISTMDSSYHVLGRLHRICDRLISFLVRKDPTTQCRSPTLLVFFCTTATSGSASTEGMRIFEPDLGSPNPFLGVYPSDSQAEVVGSHAGSPALGYPSFGIAKPGRSISVSPVALRWTRRSGGWRAPPVVKVRSGLEGGSEGRSELCVDASWLVMDCMSWRLG